MKHNEVISKVIEKSKFSSMIVNDIVNTYNEVLLDGLLEDKEVFIPSIGSIGLNIVKPNLGKTPSGEKTYLGWRYVPSIKMNTKAKVTIKEYIREEYGDV